jgi:RNA polymerase sigma factor (sigma-70 family)
MQMTAADDLPQLLPRLRPKLWAFALRLCSDRHDAEDLLQRTCLRALERPHQLRPNTTPLSWMFSIMHTTWINELRARKIRGRCRVEWNDVILDTVADPLTPTPEQNMMTGQIIEAVERRCCRGARCSHRDCHESAIARTSNLGERLYSLAKPSNGGREMSLREQQINAGRV